MYAQFLQKNKTKLQSLGRDPFLQAFSNCAVVWSSLYLLTVVTNDMASLICFLYMLRIRVCLCPAFSWNCYNLKGFLQECFSSVFCLFCSSDTPSLLLIEQQHQKDRTVTFQSLLCKGSTCKGLPSYYCWVNLPFFFFSFSE